MRFAEAMILGSASIKAKPGSVSFTGENAGCALGMAHVAMGGTFSTVPRSEWTRVGSFTFWSWLTVEFVRPCSCYTWGWLLPRTMSAKEIIAHIFDRHIFGKKDWTLERLADWIDSVDPTPRETSPEQPQTLETYNLEEKETTNCKLTLK